ncbi:MAG: hypothetical protein Q4A42_02930 [Tissierellia bacterium]|nr:hypothetical protein [Tissierellia bacterium]
MKEIKRKTDNIYLMQLVLLSVVQTILNYTATLERGYTAVGGEALAIPAMILFYWAYKNW